VDLATDAAEDANLALDQRRPVKAISSGGP
jgi:hypothetical protein